MEMTARLVEASPLVRADAGKCCVQRGPVIYCAEAVDNGEGLWALELDEDVSAGAAGVRARAGAEPAGGQGLAQAAGGGRSVSAGAAAGQDALRDSADPIFCFCQPGGQRNGRLAAQAAGMKQGRTKALEK